MSAMKSVFAIPCVALLLAGLAVGEGDNNGDGFERALPGRAWSFPADHGSHPGTRTEWWYLTGPLFAEDGRVFGFQATWFRRALVATQPPGRSPLATRDVLLFHGALTDVRAQTLLFTEEACRAYAPWARAAEGGLDLALLSHVWTAPAGELSATRLSFGAGAARVELVLDLDGAPPLLHGEEPGLSVKGHAPGEASHYASFTRLPVAGSVQLPDGESVAVSGQAWFDHEFGSSQLSGDQVGWDWFSVALDDGSDLMVYHLRLADGSADSTSSGTLRRPDGSRRHLRREDFRLEPTAHWTSPETGTRYPSAWLLSLPGEELELRVEPVLPDQELRTPGSTGVTYWEGLCRFRGIRAGRPVLGWGYVELVGYDGAFRERL